MKSLTALLAAGALAAFSTQAPARVHAVRPAQSLSFPGVFAGKVAIDGNQAFAIVSRDGGRRAVLFQRGSNGQWAQGPTLLDVTTTTDASLDDLALGNGVLAIRIGTDLHIFERSGNSWLDAPTAGTPQPAPGLAASGRIVLAARPGCAYDANVFEKSTGSGAWRVNGRITGQTTDCFQTTGLELEGNVALLVNSKNEIGEYRRNGTAFDWAQVGSLLAPPGVTFYPQAPALNDNVALSSSGEYFRRNGGAWEYQGRVQPIDSANGATLGGADFKGSLLLSTSTRSLKFSDTYAYLYLQNSSGGFDHVAALISPGNTYDVDVSGDQAITSVQVDDDSSITFYTLPTPIVAPPAVANDFDARDVSNIQQSSGSSFALANSASNFVYRQSSTSGAANAVFTDTDWANYQSIEADITPTAFDGSDRWAGLGVRYIDADNQYYVTVRGSNKLQLKKNVNGVFSTLAETTLPVTPGRKYRVRLEVSRSSLVVWIDGFQKLFANDAALTHGRAALMTFRTRADFDNVYVSPTEPVGVADKDFTVDVFDPGVPFTRQGGTWTPTEEPNGDLAGYSQTSTTADAREFVGTPTDDQRIDTRIRVDAYGDSPSGAWFGVLARWVDSRNYYYLSIRSTGRLEIRKLRNGTITTLSSVPFTATPGRFYDVRFEALGNELHAFVDGAFVAGAIDFDIARGQYGLGSYRAAFTYRTFDVEQP